MKFFRMLFVAVITAGAICAQASWYTVSSNGPFKKADAAYKNGLYPQVIQILSPESMQLVPPGHLERAYQELADSYVRLGRMSQALGTYQLGVKLFPADVQLLADFGNLLHQAGLDEQAKPLFDAALKLAPGNTQANIGMAQIDGALGFLNRSQAHYFKAIQTVKNNPQIWAEYAEILWRLKDYPKAEDAVQKSLALSSATQTEILLAFIQRSDGHLAQALDTLGQAAAQDPDRADIALARALWMTEAGRWGQAASLNARTLAKFPDNSLALWIQASILLHAGHQNAAKAALKEAAKSQEETPFVAAVAAKMLGPLKRQ